MEILAAQQTLTNTSWYEGTADAVRKNLDPLSQSRFRLPAHPERRPVVPDGFPPDHRPARRDRRGHHRRHHSGQPAATRNRSASCRSARTGASRGSSKNRRTRPCWTPSGCRRNGTRNSGSRTTANCSSPRWAFTFSTAALICELLDNPLTDFGKHIIPHAISSHRVFSYIFQGYWEDIGTIRSFFEANLDLVSELPRFNFFDMSAPIFSRPRLPARLQDQRRAD